MVNITIVNPTAITLSPVKITNGQFSFNYTANSGLSYVIQDSSNLVNWLSLATNVPTSNSVNVTENVIPQGAQFYRVTRLPNP